MGPPPRSLTAEANSCFMVRVPHGPTEYKVRRGHRARAWAPLGTTIPNLEQRRIWSCSNTRHESPHTRLRKNSDVELARRKFVSIALNKKRSDLPVTVGRRKERKQFCAFSARARFHTAWTHFRHRTSLQIYFSRPAPTSSKCRVWT